MATVTLPTSTTLAAGQNYAVIQVGQVGGIEAGRSIRKGSDGLAYYATNSDITRSIVIGVTVSKAYSAGQWVVYALDACTLTVSGLTKGVQYYLDHGTDEVHTYTITGVPTGGSFQLSFVVNGVTLTTIAIAFNATGATLQTALETIFGVGNIGVAGGAGGPYTATFKLVQGAALIALPTLTNALTGGTTPSVSLVETTPGAATGNVCLFADLTTGFAVTTVLLALSATSCILNPTYSGVVI